MHTTCSRLLAALILGCGFWMTGSVHADQVRMKNGDVITGSVSKIEDGELFIEPAYADEFSVDLAEVESVESETVFEIELKDGNTLDASIGLGEQGQQALIVDGSAQTVVLAELVAATEPEDWYDRVSHVDVNMTWNSGNTDSRNNLIFADTRIKMGDHRHLGEITIRRDETEGTSTKKQDLLNYSYNWLFNEPWYLGATASYERDPIKDLDHRYTVGATVGRDLFDDSRKFLTASLGLGYSEEKIAGLADSGATGLWRLIYEHDFRNGDLTFFHNQNLDYQFYGANNAVFKTNTGFRFDIISDVYTSVSVRWDYESEPAANAKNNDTTLAIGVGAKF
jgi:putative salt-induced outer membrane protein YdiY